MTSGSPHKVTVANQRTVTDLKSFGVTNEEIATYLQISVETLVKKYKRELETARADKVRAVAESLYQKALGGDVTAQIFFLKTQGRWRTEDNKSVLDSNSELQEQIKKLREELDAKNRKEY